MRAQIEPRFRKRIPCQVTVGDSAYTGLVLNVSRGGLFIQTAAQALPGDEVRIDLKPSDSRIPVGARVVWKRVVASHLRSVTHPGVGLQIHNAPESYFRLLMDVSAPGPGGAKPSPGPAPTRRRATAAPRRPSATPFQRPARPRPPEPAPPETHRYRVRLKQKGSPRSRVVELEGANEDEARRLALDRLGDDWLVLELQQL